MEGQQRQQEPGHATAVLKHVPLRQITYQALLRSLAAEDDALRKIHVRIQKQLQNLEVEEKLIMQMIQRERSHHSTEELEAFDRQEQEQQQQQLQQGGQQEQQQTEQQGQSQGEHQEARIQLQPAPGQRQQECNVVQGEQHQQRQHLQQEQPSWQVQQQAGKQHRPQDEGMEIHEEVF